MEEEWMTTNQAAEYLGMTRPRVQQLIKAGALKAEKFGRDYRLTKREVQQWKEEAAQRNQGKKGRPFKT